MGRAEKIASWTKENRFFVIAGVLIVLCVIVVVPIFAQSLNRLDGDYSTPALYLFSTIAQTMGAILGIVFAVFFAVYANMRSNPENPTIDYARSYLQSDWYFLSAALVGLFCILGSVVCLLMIYASGSLLNITVMLLLGILCLVLGLVSITLLLYFVTVRVPLYFEPIELYKEQRELLKKRKNVSESEYRKFLVDTLLVSSISHYRDYLLDALIIIRDDYGYKKENIRKYRDHYNVLRDLIDSLNFKLSAYPKINQHQTKLNIIDVLGNAINYYIPNDEMLEKMLEKDKVILGKYHKEVDYYCGEHFILMKHIYDIIDECIREGVVISNNDIIKIYQIISLKCNLGVNLVNLKPKHIAILNIYLKFLIELQKKDYRFYRLIDVRLIDNHVIRSHLREIFTCNKKTYEKFAKNYIIYQCMTFFNIIECFEKTNYLQSFENDEIRNVYQYIRRIERCLKELYATCRSNNIGHPQNKIDIENQLYECSKRCNLQYTQYRYSLLLFLIRKKLSKPIFDGIYVYFSEYLNLPISFAIYLCTCSEEGKEWNLESYKRDLLNFYRENNLNYKELKGLFEDKNKMEIYKAEFENIQKSYMRIIF